MQTLELECLLFSQTPDLTACGNLDKLLNRLVQSENEIITRAHEAKVRIKWYLHVQFLVHSKNSIKCQLLLLCVS